MRLVTLGESLARLDAAAVGPLRHARSLGLGVAGAESNVAIGFSRLGGEAAWIGRVGADEFGGLVRATLAGEGVDLAAAVVDPSAPTGLLVKERRTSALTRVWYYRTGSAGSRLSPEDVPEDLVRTAQTLHVTGITAALSATARKAVRHAVATARAAGVPVSLDLNYRAALWEPDEAARELRRLAAEADIVFATEREARLLVDGEGPAELAGALARLGAREVLVKLGRHGAVACCDGVLHRAPGVRVEPVDPVGAGDAFAAAYLAERLRGVPVGERLAVAALAGAYVVTAMGDWEGLPSRADLEREPGDEVLR
ncbi:sugar kinase [Spirillospora sp. CA-294931]|uniref:sugar kinase n=1 Tax=Spirillospora sp. CA-294931 TaxID=3240042 RepID=UPI003D8EABB9